MLIERFTCTGHNIYLEEFEDIHEFVHMSDERPENSWSHKTDVSDNDRNWLMHGWNSMKDRIESQLIGLEDTITTVERKIKERVYCINGYYPSVSRAVRGNPRCMAKYKTTTRASKIVEIIWDPGAAWHVKSETVAEQGVKLLAKIKMLELMGYRVRLMVQGFKGEQYTDEVYMCRMTIKEENQPLDLSRIAYPLANVEMLRTWVFHWYEHLPGARHIDGYGKSLYLWDDDKRQQILDAVNVNANQYYVNLGTNIDEMFKPLTNIE